MVEYPEEALQTLDLIRVEDCEISVRTANCLTNTAKYALKVEPRLGVFARMTPKERLEMPNYGRRTEKEFVQLVEGLLHGIPRAAVAKATVREPLHPYAWSIYQQFLSNPTYANLTFRNIASRAFAAAREYRYVKDAVEITRG